MAAIITICARANSQGLRNKHTRKVCGKPLIEWTLTQAYNSKSSVAEKVYIYSDIVNRFPYLHYTHIDRPFLNDGPKLDTLRELLPKIKVDFDTVIDLDATNPCRTVQDIQNAVNIFKETGAKTVVSVVKSKKTCDFNQVRTKDGEMYDWGAKTARQETAQWYDLNSNICVYDRAWLEDPAHKHPVCDQTAIYEMPEWSRNDIDTEYDFFLAEKSFERYYLDQA